MKRNSRSMYIRLEQDTDICKSHGASHYNDDDKYNALKQIKSPEQQNRTTVEIFFFYHNVYVYKQTYVGVYPNISKYARTAMNQKMNTSWLLIFFLPSDDLHWFNCYLPWDITFRYFIEDCGFNTKFFYYIDQYLLIDKELDMTIQELYDQKIFQKYIFIRGYPKKLFFSSRNPKRIEPSYHMDHNFG